MSLTNLSFIGIYLPILLIAYYNPFFKTNGFRKILLLLANLALYTFCEPVYILLLLAIFFVNYLLVVLSNKSGKKSYRAIAIVIDVLILLFFKYINKFLAFGIINPSFSYIAFPIGLSYFTFKTISFVVDSAEEKSGNVLDASIYVTNFLTIVAGPLSTYKTELPVIKNKKTPSLDNAYRGIERAIIGLAKKIIIADSLGVLANQCFMSSNLSVVMAWAGAIAYTLQLFFDFSGYTDMAIGLGSLFGFDLPENFNYPYMASSISDFWKRWHMSLTKWLRIYVYIPLGGSRVKTLARHIFNLFVVWMVTGIWHGSTMTFIVWAMFFWVFLLLEKFTNFLNFLNKIHLGHVYTLLVAIFAWVIFRSWNLASAFLYIRSMFGCNNNLFCAIGDLATIAKYKVPLVLAIIFSANIGLKIKNLLSSRTYTKIVYNLAILLLFIVCILILMGHGYSAPLYAGF